MDYSDTNSHTHIAHMRFVKLKRYKTITIASRASRNRPRHATTIMRLARHRIRLRACATRAGRRSALCTMIKPKKLKACRVPQNAPVAPRWLHLQVGELGVSPLSPVPGDPTLKQRDRRRPSREPGNVVSTEFSLDLGGCRFFVWSMGWSPAPTAGPG